MPDLVEPECSSSPPPFIMRHSSCLSSRSTTSPKCFFFGLYHHDSGHPSNPRPIDGADATVTFWNYAGDSFGLPRRIYLLRDHLGSVRVTADSSGTSVGIYHYYPYGGDLNLVTPPSALDSLPLFPGSFEPSPAGGDHRSDRTGHPGAAPGKPVQVHWQNNGRWYWPGALRLRCPILHPLLAPLAYDGSPRREVLLHLPVRLLRRGSGEQN